MQSEKIFLEDSNGKIVNNPSEEDISAALENIGTKTEHCILNLDSDISFIQAAGSKNSLFIQYSDNSGIYESSRNDMKVSEVSEIFKSASHGDTNWKKRMEFSLIDSNAGKADSGKSCCAGNPSCCSNENTQKKSFKDQILDAVKYEATANATKVVRKGIRNLFGNKF